MQFCTTQPRNVHMHAVTHATHSRNLPAASTADNPIRYCCCVALLLQGLSRTPIQLLRLPQLVWYLLRLQLADTPRQRQRLWSEQQWLLGYVLPLHTLVLLLGLVFCVASPLIAPVTLIYFVVASVTQRYQWIYIYRHPYEGAGTLWRQVFNQVRMLAARCSCWDVMQLISGMWLLGWCVVLGHECPQSLWPLAASIDSFVCLCYTACRCLLVCTSLWL
jgi:hypothetical protein